MAKGVLIAAMDFSSCPEDEFHDWYDMEHVPERLRVPGFLNAERWIDTGNPKISVATYDLDTVAVLRSPPYLAIAGANSSPWTKRTQRFRKSLLRYEGEQILPGDAARAGQCRRAAAGRDDPGGRGRDRVQRLVRHRARPGAGARPRGAVRAPLPDERRQHEIRGALPPDIA